MSVIRLLRFVSRHERTDTCGEVWQRDHTILIAVESIIEQLQFLVYRIYIATACMLQEIAHIIKSQTS